MSTAFKRHGTHHARFLRKMPVGLRDGDRFKESRSK